MTIDANASFRTFSPISETLTIFFLTIDTIASTWWVFNSCWESRGGCSLLTCTGLIKLTKYLSNWFLFRELYRERRWFFKHIFFVFNSKNIFTLNLNSLVLHMNALTIHAMESFLIAQKCLHIHNKKFIDFIKSWQIKRLKHVKIERKLIEHWFRVNIFTLKLTYFKFLRFLKNCWIFSKSFYLDYKLNLNLMINSFTFQK